MRRSAQHWMYALPAGAQAPTPICDPHVSAQSTCKAPHAARRSQTTPQASATDRVLVETGAGEGVPSPEVEAGAGSPGLAFGSSAILPPHDAQALAQASISTRFDSLARAMPSQWPRGRASVGIMASPAGLGPATPCLGNTCSIQLSYGDRRRALPQRPPREKRVNLRPRRRADAAACYVRERVIGLFALLFRRIRRAFGSLHARLLADLSGTERVVLLGVAILHVVGIGWGLPASDGWDVDGVSPRDFLPGVLKTFTPGDYFTYPPLHLLLLTVLTLPVTVVALVRAPSLSQQDVIQAFVHVPVATTFALVARVVSLLMSLGIVLAVGRMASAIFGPRARSWAMAIAGVEVAGTYYAHTSNLDVPALFWASCALLTLVLAVQADEPRKLRRVAILAACAIATKDQTYAIFALSLPCVLVLWAIARHRSGTLRELVRETFYLALLGLLLVLLFDGALVNPTGFLARLRFLTGPASQDFAQYSRDWPGRIAALEDAITFLPAHYPIAMAPVFVLGMALALRRSRGRERIAALVPMLAILSFTLTFNCVARRVEERFMLPQMQLLAVYGGGAIAVALDAAARAAGSPRGRRILTSLVMVAAIGCLLSGLRSSAMVVSTMLGDARYDAESYLREHVRPDDVIEVYGNNVYFPRFPANAHVQRIGPGPVTGRNPMADIEEKQAPLGAVGERAPRWIVISSGYAWRFRRDAQVTADGRLTPESQRKSLADIDATNHIRGLFAGTAGYDVVHTARYEGHLLPLLPPRPLHASLACDVFIFERR